MPCAARGFVAVVVCFGFVPLVPGQIVLGPPVESPAAGGSMAAADLNGDGYQDLVSRALASSVSFGDGRGHFTAPVPTVPAFDFIDLDVGDVDGDGQPDLLGAWSLPATGKQIYVMRGLGGTAFEVIGIYDVSSVGVFGGGPTVQVVDSDADGDLDVLVTVHVQAASLGPEVLLMLNDGTGSFTLQHVLFVQGTFGVEVQAADLDGDHLSDVVVSLLNPFFPETGAITVYRGLPDGTFEVGATWSASRVATIADLDGDGIFDILTFHIPTGSMEAHLGAGDGSFTQGPVTVVGDNNAFPHAIADFDSDGILDLLLYQPNPEQHSHVRLGDGHGGFIVDQAVKFYFGNASDFLVADVIPDGRPDLVFHESIPPVFELYTLTNRTYPQPGPLLDLGYAEPFVTTWPMMLASGTFRGGGAVEFELFLGPPHSQGVLVAGFSEAYTPYYGGVIVPSADLVIGPFTTSSEGVASVVGHWPVGVPTGTEVTFQFLIQPAGSQPPSPTYCSTSAVRVTTP